MDPKQREELEGLKKRLGIKGDPVYDQPDQIIATLRRIGAPFHDVRPDQDDFIGKTIDRINQRRTARTLPSPHELYRIAAVPSVRLEWLRLRVARLMQGISHDELASKLTRRGLAIAKPQLRYRETDPDAPRGRHAPLDDMAPIVAKCLNVDCVWLKTGSWTDIPIEKRETEYSLSETAKILGCSKRQVEQKIMTTKGLFLVIDYATEVPRISISDEVFYERALALGFSNNPKPSNIKDFSEMVTLMVKAKQHVLKLVLGEEPPQQAHIVLPGWLTIYAIAVQHAWRLVQEVNQGLLYGKSSKLGPPPKLDEASPSRWANLYFQAAVQPSLGNYQRSMRENPRLREMMRESYLRMHGFIHQFPIIYPYLKEAGTPALEEDI